MIHGLLLEVERPEQKNGSFCHFRGHDFLPNGKQWRSPQLEVHWAWIKRILPRNNVVKFNATLRILSKKKIELNVDFHVIKVLQFISYIDSYLLHNQLCAQIPRREQITRFIT